MHRRLLALTRDSRLPLSLTILSGLFAGLLTVWQAWLLSSVINAVFLKQHALPEVIRPLILILFPIGGRVLLSGLNEIAANAVAVKIKTDLRERLFTHILKLGPAYARTQRTGELSAAAMEGIEALDAYFSQYLPQLVVTALVPLSILLFVFPIDLLSGFVFLITAPLIPFFMIMIGRGAEIVTGRQYETLRLLSAHFLDSLQGLTTLKLFGQARAQTERLAEASDRFRDTTLGVLRITFLSALALELLATLSTAIIAVEIGFRLLYARLEFQPALFLLVLAPEFYMPLRALGARFHAGLSGTSAAKRIYEILDTPVGPSQGVSQDPIPSTKGPTIALSEVSFIYPGETRPALDDISLIIPHGTHLALVGPSGAGKSTLVNLLMRFIEPTRGNISMTPPSAADIPAEIWRASIAWVPQTPFLFHDTIAANIRLGKAGATQAEIVRAAQAAHLHEFIGSLPQGYDTQIGENGARLSSGQAQRLALARAFLKDSPVLILDEPTSSLDPETETLVEDSTRRLMQGRTTITIAHRLNTIFQADQIVVLESGRILEMGGHRELLAKKGAYARMVKLVEENSDAGASVSKRGIQGESIESLNFRPASTGSQLETRAQAPAILRLLKFLDGSWDRVALSVVLGALTIGSGIALMGTSAWLISTAARHPSLSALGVAVVGVRFFGIARGVFRYLERLVSHDVTFRLLARLRTWFYEKLEPLAPARLMEFHAGDLLARIIGDVGTLENFYVRVISPPLTAILTGFFVFIFVAAFGLQLALTFLIFFLSLGVLLPVLSELLSRRPAKEAITARAELHTHLVDGIQGLADLLAYGRAQDQLGRISASGKIYGGAQRRMARAAALHSALSTLLTNLGLWSILVLAIPLVHAGSLEGPMLASLTLLTFASFEAVIPLPQAAQMWNASREAARRLFEVVDTRPQVIDDLHPLAVPASIPAAVEFSHLTFAYPSRSIPALRDILIHIPAGKSIGIVGPSGAGKSTLTSLLLRFWEYRSGDILLSGESLHRLAQEDVRAQIGLVSQNTYFFNTSVYENLRFARRRVTPEQVESAAKAARIHDFICGLPKGYDTLIGEQGLRLSGGERQRLAIARALIKDAPILILDEPTANLDPLAEKDVLETLFAVMKRKTCIWLTHRLIGMEHLDQILVMDRGRVVEQGTHARLVGQAGLYHRLWDLQNRILGGEI